METPKIIPKPCLPVDKFEECMRNLWPRYLKLQADTDNLRIEMLNMEVEKARLTRECETLRHLIETWEGAEASHRRCAALLTDRLHTALTVLCKTELCSDGRSISDHIHDAIMQLTSIQETPSPETIIPTLLNTKSHQDLQNTTKENKYDEFFF